MFPLPANIYAEIAAFATSAIFWNKIKTSSLCWLCPFLLFIVIVELSGRYIYMELGQINAWLYNLSIPIEYLFYAFLFYSFYNKQVNKKLALGFIILFALWVPVSLFIVNGFFLFNNNFLKTGSISIVLLCLLYFFEILMAENMVNPFHLPMFWLACGLFLFNAGEFTYNTFSDWLLDEWAPGKKLFGQINNNLIFVLYTSIIIAIITPLWAHRDKT